MTRHRAFSPSDPNSAFMAGALCAGQTSGLDECLGALSGEKTGCPSGETEETRGGNSGRGDGCWGATGRVPPLQTKRIARRARYATPPAAKPRNQSQSVRHTFLTGAIRLDNFSFIISSYAIQITVAFSFSCDCGIGSYCAVNRA
jgi:hypothetical protein